MKPTVGLFNVDLVAQNLLIWEGPAEVVNEVEEPGQCVSIGCSRHTGNVDSLIHGAALFPIVREIMSQTFLRYGPSGFVYCLLGLEAEWIYFGVLQFVYSRDGYWNPVSQLYIGLHGFGDMDSGLL